MRVWAWGVPECAVIDSISVINHDKDGGGRTEQSNRLLDRVVPDSRGEQVRVQKVLRGGPELRIVLETALNNLGVTSKLNAVPTRWENDLGLPELAKDLSRGRP